MTYDVIYYLSKLVLLRHNNPFTKPLRAGRIVSSDTTWHRQLFISSASRPFITTRLVMPYSVPSYVYFNKRPPRGGLHSN